MSTAGRMPWPSARHSWWCPACAGPAWTPASRLSLRQNPRDNPFVSQVVQRNALPFVYGPLGLMRILDFVAIRFIHTAPLPRGHHVVQRIATDRCLPGIGRNGSEENKTGEKM